MGFERGNKLAAGGARTGSGPKPALTTQSLRELLDATVPDATRRTILKKQVELAKEGNTKAAAFVFAYCFGKPKMLPDEPVIPPRPGYDLSKLTDEELNDFTRLAEKCAGDTADAGGEGAA